MYLLIENYSAETTAWIKTWAEKHKDVYLTILEPSIDLALDIAKYDAHREDDWHLDEIIFVYGSIRFVSLIKRLADQSRYIVYPYDFKKYDCSDYYYLLKEDLLNYGQHQYATLDTLERQLTQDQSWFVRPNSCKKPFAGSVWKDVKKEIAFLRQLNISESEFILFSPVYENILGENRYWVGPDGIIACDQYINMEEIEHINLDYTDDYLKSQVELVLKTYEKLQDNGLDEILVIDVSEQLDVDGHMPLKCGELVDKIVEINAVSTSGIYSQEASDFIFDYIYSKFGER